MSVLVHRSEMTHAIDIVAVETDCTMIEAAIRLVERAMGEHRDVDDVVSDVLEGRLTFRQETSDA